MRLRALLPLLAVLAPPGAPAAAQVPNAGYADAIEGRRAPADPAVSYVVRADTTDLGGYAVTMVVRHAPARARVALPRWAPGAYRLVEFGRFAQDLAVTRDGAPVAATRDSTGAWRLAPGRAGATLEVRYRVRFPTPEAAATPSNRSFLTARGALFDGPLTYAFLPGLERLPAHVRFDVPRGWQVATGLVPTADPRVFFAPSYDVLIDSPALAAPSEALGIARFAVDGVPHRVVVWTRAGAPAIDPEKVATVADTIVRTASAIMGGLPYREYTFLYVDGVGSALEHLNSTTIPIRPAQLARTPDAAASVTAHEYFHLWNVKRLRPAELGPFDYLHAVRTPNLWWSEGVTDYFADEILRRIGLRDSAAAVRDFAEALGSWLDNPAAIRVSPERASRTVWDPASVNDGYAISYYLQGKLLGELLELRLRGATDGARGMDDLIRAMYARWAGARGFTAADLARTASATCGCDLAPLFAAHVRAARPIDWNRWLALAGWRLDTTRVTATDTATGRPRPDLRASVVAAGGVGTAGGWAGGPPKLSIPGPTDAAYRAGLRSGDVVRSLNGRPIDGAEAWRAAVRDVQVGDTVTIAVERDGRPITARAVPRSYMALRVRLVDLPALDARQRRVRQAWLRGAS